MSLIAINNMILQVLQQNSNNLVTCPTLNVPTVATPALPTMLASIHSAIDGVGPVSRGVDNDGEFTDWALRAFRMDDETHVRVYFSGIRDSRIPDDQKVYPLEQG